MTTEELFQRFENERNYLEADMVGVQNETHTMNDRIEQMKKLIEEYGEAHKNRQNDQSVKLCPETPSVIEREKNAGKRQKENRRSKSKNKSQKLPTTPSKERWSQCKVMLNAADVSKAVTPDSKKIKKESDPVCTIVIDSENSETDFFPPEKPASKATPGRQLGSKAKV